MVDVNRGLFRYREDEWVRANDGRVGVVLQRQAGLVYRIRCGPGEFFYAQSQLCAAERPGRPAGEGGGAAEPAGNEMPAESGAILPGHREPGAVASSAAHNGADRAGTEA